ncbi:MAG: hypothetical protein QM778_30460 [Myxococcales bacterium]
MILAKAKPHRAWILGLLLGACSGDPAPSRQTRRTTEGDSGTPDPGPGDGDGDGDGSSASQGWAVTLSADKVELCPGECTTLRAALPESDSELHFAWSAGLSGTKEVQVCPGETTTYDLTLSEVPQAGAELTSARTATDQLTVSIKSCDPASPVLCEVRYRYDFPSDDNVLLSNQPWLASQAFHSTLQPTPDDGVVIMAAFGQRVDLGAGVVSSGSAANGLIHKYDKDCKPVWTKVMAPSLKSDVLIPLALSVDKAGNSYVAAMAGPLINFNPLVPLSTTFATELVIHKFSSAGQQVYRKAFAIGGGLAAGGMISDAVVDDVGQLYVAGMAHAWTDFGRGALDLSVTAYRPFLLKLDAQGNSVSQRASSVYQLARANDRLVFLDGGSGGFDLLGSLFAPPANTEAKLTAVSMSDLTPMWSNPISNDDAWIQAMAGYSDGHSGAFANEQIYDEDDTTYTTTDRWSIQPFGIDGTRGAKVVFMENKVQTPKEVDAGFLGFEASPYIQLLHHNAEGTLALGGSYFAPWRIDALDVTLAYDAATQTEGNSRYGMPFALKLDANQKLIWARTPEWGQRPFIGGLGVDTRGDVWLHGQGQVASTSGGGKERDMVVSKLRGTP